MVLLSRKMANRLATTAYVSGGGALGALAMGSPIGAAGGALFGAVSYISSQALRQFGKSCLHSEHPQAPAAKALAKAIEIFGRYAAAWGALALAGFSLTLSHVVGFIIVSEFAAIGLAVLIVITENSYSRMAFHRQEPIFQ